MKRTIAAATIAAMAAFPVIAQEATAPADRTAPAVQSEAPAAPMVKSAAMNISASKLINESVKNAANETIGDINDVLISSDGKVAAVIIGVGGFLGLGEKNVALPFDQLMFAHSGNDDLVVSTSMTKESLQTAPEYVKPKDRS